MKTTVSCSRKVFLAFNNVLLVLLALVCILPFIHVIAISFSGKAETSAGMVGLWPVGFNIDTYAFLLKKTAFWNAFLRSVERLVLGTSINLFLIILTAYPLSRSNAKLPERTIYSWFFFITMLISGGLIPTYVLVANLHLRDTIWALVLPRALPAFNLVLMLNFFRRVPQELEEAALIDGAGHLRTLVQIFIPVSIPAISTIALFCMVNHWNAWFDGLIYTNTPGKLPLQSYLRSIVIEMDMSQMDSESWADVQEMSNRALKCAQIVIATLPILCVYPFLQRYFVTGLVLGSVKG
ncbi:MAG TPA: carbohydrate ABC transporter permease [Candidatus Limiplasma sp.]|nr:carbohydrate ABC transporter permease [Candidatus Limiplasma sp.]